MRLVRISENDWIDEESITYIYIDPDGTVRVGGVGRGYSGEAAENLKRYLTGRASTYIADIRQIDSQDEENSKEI